MTIFDVPASAPSILQIIWLLLVAVLWIGFFFLEGFDFGVGMLVPFLGKTDQDRRVVMNTIGPHWDGNEVWLLTAGGAMFAAFPTWYATLFSGLYLPLLLVLLGLIMRGVALEYRSKDESPTWRAAFDWILAIGSLLPPLVFGVGFANFVKGLALTTVVNNFGTTITLFSGTFLGLFSPFALVGGLLVVALCLVHGAHFVGLKTVGGVHDTARSFANILGIATMVLALVFVLWANLAYFNLPGQTVGWLKMAGWVTGVVALVCLALGWFMNSKDRDGWAFIGTALATVMLVAMFFTHLYPALGFDNSGAMSAPIDLTTASSSATTLTIMTWAAVCLVPVVLAYTVWSYFIVFRRRLSTANMPLDVATAA